MKNTTFTDDVLRVTGSLTLVALPLLLAVTFALHFTSFADLFDIKFVKPVYSAGHLLQTLSTPDKGFRSYILPHVIGYLALPLFIPVSLILARVTMQKTPWHAIAGATMTCIGVVFMGGVFGAWLSFAAVANVPPEVGVLAVLEALTRMQGTLMLSSVLSAFTFAGMIVLGFGLYRYRDVPRWSAICFIIGNLIILFFIDLDNWMFIGAILMLVGMTPLSLKLLRDRRLMIAYEITR